MGDFFTLLLVLLTTVVFGGDWLPNGLERDCYYNLTIVFPLDQSGCTSRVHCPLNSGCKQGYINNAYKDASVDLCICDSGYMTLADKNILKNVRYTGMVLGKTCFDVNECTLGLSELGNKKEKSFFFFFLFYSFLSSISFLLSSFFLSFFFCLFSRNIGYGITKK